MHRTNFIIGMMLGGIAGAVAALLLAPKSGKALREDLNQGVTEMKGWAADWSETAYVKANEWRERASVKGSEWKDIAYDFKDKAVDATAQLSQKAQDLTERVRDTEQER